MGRTPQRPGYAALRRGRVSLADHSYLVTAVTAGRRPVFRDLTAGRLVVRALRRIEPVAPTHCYVIMPDHLHWLLHLRGAMDLASVVQRVKGWSARDIGRVTPRHRPVWQAGFHDHAVRADTDLRGLARYIVANPLRAGLVEHIGDYPLWDAVWVEDGGAGG
ncbi:transposase [Aquisalimonas lutea]|uniref:REP-associated tyrosine transposase n=1 Tax=Aquisalimonas lutea TaxID=1327750 RepID=UPI0025B5F0AE|nr:transposase [Aquisalimonas lutea]MDN3516230.1 transposase [Aquisalimonas lutea]